LAHFASGGLAAGPPEAATVLSDPHEFAELRDDPTRLDVSVPGDEPVDNDRTVQGEPDFLKAMREEMHQSRQEASLASEEYALDRGTEKDEATRTVPTKRSRLAAGADEPVGATGSAVPDVTTASPSLLGLDPGDEVLRPAPVKPPVRTLKVGTAQGKLLLAVPANASVMVNGVSAGNGSLLLLGMDPQARVPVEVCHLGYQTWRTMVSLGGKHSGQVRVELRRHRA
jgi:hypothetical protein